MARRADRDKLGLTEKNVETGEPTLTPAEKLAETYRRTFTTETGAAVLEDLRLRFGNRRSYVPDSNATAFHEGQRDLYLMILSLVERKPQATPTQET